MSLKWPGGPVEAGGDRPATGLETLARPALPGKAGEGCPPFPALHVLIGEVIDSRADNLKLACAGGVLRRARPAASSAGSIPGGAQMATLGMILSVVGGIGALIFTIQILILAF